ncbi:hypothetical protein BN1221_04625 [Brenneria goodwinii]|uniref:Uncharacterized protein n=1 Tax=Brenneria goodwinii TaxID=1109412 RepID=A0A0G4K1Y0_9GAMM|nr:hypothetical protein BN1221_04625 [Brenneria goodwinii]
MNRFSFYEKKCVYRERRFKKIIAETFQLVCFHYVIYASIPHCLRNEFMTSRTF